MWHDLDRKAKNKELIVLDQSEISSPDGHTPNLKCTTFLPEQFLGGVIPPP